mgnify:CR=1 FL=1
MMTIIIAFAAFCLGFFVAGLMAEAKRNDEAEEANGKNTGK